MIFASFTTVSYKKFYLVKDEYGMKLENNEYFLAIYPEELELNNEVVENIYDGNEDFKFPIKFLDKNEKEVKDILLVKGNN